MKKLRRALSPLKIRYFGVGEYGEKSERPHYHGIIFGADPIWHRDILEKSWDKGFAYVGTVTKDSASYVAGYVTKKMTHKEEKCNSYCSHPKLNGRKPEFARMSLKPGLGAEAMDSVASTTMDYGLKDVLENADVTNALRVGNKMFPIGRYLKGKLRENVGIGKKTQEDALIKTGARMRIMLEEGFKEARKKGKDPYKEHLAALQQKALNFENKTKLYQSQKEKLL